MKVITIESNPTNNLDNIIKEISAHYKGDVITENHNSKINEMIGELKYKKNKLLSELEKLSHNVNETIFNELLNTLNTKVENKDKDLIFIYIQNKKQIEVLKEKYQTITVDKDFMFNINEYNTNDKALELINRLAI